MMLYEVASKMASKISLFLGVIHVAGRTDLSHTDLFS